MAGPDRRVLITNVQLTERTGTELYVRDLALELRRRGHEPVLYAPRCGEPAAALRSAGLRVVDDLAELDAVPDLIHAHHVLEAAVAALRFPGVPAVFVAHSAAGWIDEPPLLSAVRRYVAVDETVRERLLADGVDPHTVQVVHNGIDLERFRPRDVPLPPAPRRALVFSNYTERGSWLAAVRAACDRAGVQLDVAGAPPATPLEQPEAVLGRYDLVFAKARSAMEALAVGCAVVVCDFTGVAGMVGPEDVDVLRPRNFGARTMVHPHTPAVLDAAIAAYDPVRAAAASARYRAGGGLREMVDQLLTVYDGALADPPPAVATASDARRFAALFRRASADRWDLAYKDVVERRLRAELAAVAADRDAIVRSRTWRLRTHALPLLRRWRAAGRGAPRREV